MGSSRSQPVILSIPQAIIIIHFNVELYMSSHSLGHTRVPVNLLSRQPTTCFTATSLPFMSVLIRTANRFSSQSSHELAILALLLIQPIALSRCCACKSYLYGQQSFQKYPFREVELPESALGISLALSQGDEANRAFIIRYLSPCHLYLLRWIEQLWRLTCSGSGYSIGRPYRSL